MKSDLYGYIEEIDNLLKDDGRIGEDVIQNHLIKIGFFQHERFIHLIVTLFYAIIFLLFAALGFVHPVFFSITLILLIFLICYIIHYFRLENGVQYLYKQYDRMRENNHKKTT